MCAIFMAESEISISLLTMPAIGHDTLDAVLVPIYFLFP
jgi:hypothetical protein